MCQEWPDLWLERYRRAADRLLASSLRFGSLASWCPMPFDRAFKTGAAAAFFALLLTGAPQAHHTYVTKYNSADKVRLSGTVSSVSFSNPHIFFTLQTGKGSWTVETESIPVAKAKGLTANLLKDGAKVSVTGWPARSGAAELGLNTISFSGGPTILMRGTAR